METNHGGKRANSGRKPLPDTAKKKTSVIRIDAELLPLVEKLKQGLPVTKNQVWQQTSALSEDDLKEQANYIERLMTDKAQLSAQVQQLEKQLQKIKFDDGLQAETEALKANNFRLAEKSGNLETQLNAAKNDLAQAKLEPGRLKAALSEAKRELAKQQRHSCQCLTAKGIQCDKPASHENKVNGFMIWTCEQHYKMLPKL